MANKIVKKAELLHYNSEYDVCPSPGVPISSSKSIDTSVVPASIDKSKSISDFDDEGLHKLIYRLRNEKEAEDIIRSLRRSAGEEGSYENPSKIDTKTPIDQLYHHGILGQKWGIRRFQKLDGTRTPAGKKRDATRANTKSEDHVKSRESKRKSPEGLSNEELRKLNERLQLEATYKNLTTAKVQKSESFVKKALRDGGGQALTEFSKGVFLGSAKLLVKELSPSFAETAFNIRQRRTMV